jgi:hypothetical protein
MLYLHGGWPRTGTSSLQTVLAAYKEELTADGLVYPEEWRDSAAVAHHGLYDLLESSLQSKFALDGFRTHLDTLRDGRVLLSAEGLANWLLTPERLGGLIRLSRLTQGVMPTTFVWTLRRFDDAFASLYLYGLAMGVTLPPLTENDYYVDRLDNPFNARCAGELFDAMRELGKVCSGAVYVMYDSGGLHNQKLLRAFGISDPLTVRLLRQLDAGPRRNVRLSHKQVIVLLNLDALSERTAVELDGALLRKAFRRGEVRFVDDRPCELLSLSTRECLHEAALAAAREVGFAPYMEFFGSATVEGGESIALDPDALTDEDLEKIVVAMGDAGQYG